MLWLLNRLKTKLGSQSNMSWGSKPFLSTAFANFNNPRTVTFSCRRTPASFYTWSGWIGSNHTYQLLLGCCVEKIVMFRRKLCWILLVMSVMVWEKAVPADVILYYFLTIFLFSHKNICKKICYSQDGFVLFFNKFKVICFPYLISVLPSFYAASVD